MNKSSAEYRHLLHIALKPGLGQLACHRDLGVFFFFGQIRKRRFRLTDQLFFFFFFLFSAVTAMSLNSILQLNIKLSSRGRFFHITCIYGVQERTACNQGIAVVRNRDGRGGGERKKTGWGPYSRDSFSVENGGKAGSTACRELGIQRVVRLKGVAIVRKCAGNGIFLSPSSICIEHGDKDALLGGE